MTNNEILQASLLDILFDKRNKDYGAYILRRDYNRRLLLALGAALMIVLSFILISLKSKKEEPKAPPVFRNQEIVIRPYNIEPEKPKEPEMPKEKIKSVTKIAQVKYQTPKIVPDKIVKKNLPTIAEVKNKIISDKDVEGKKDDGKPENTIVTNKPDAGNGGNGNSTGQGSTFIPEERSPEFPGGQEALVRFLKTNLITPEELQVGEKKTVQVRFKVDIDGTISSVEVVQSGGGLFDKEVMRVCKKMPRWKPAFQNGSNIAVSYILPVTFIGVEQ